MGKRSILEGEQAKLDLMLQLYNQGLNIGPDQVAALLSAGLINNTTENDETVALDNGAAVSLSVKKYQRSNIITDPRQQEADTHITIIYTDTDKNPLFAKKERVVTDRLFKQQIESAAVFAGTHKKITDDMWRPKSKTDHTKEFVQWIDSINRPDGFWNSIHYKPYELYCQQSAQWLREQPPELRDEEAMFEYKINENARCKENTLYSCDKYGELKEANVDAMHKYVSAKVHKVILYLLDCGYSDDIVKARQIAFTTTIALWVLNKCMYNFNLGVKFISENKIKAEDTLENKIKYVFSKYPSWIKPEGRNDRMQRIVFGEPGGKGEREGNNSGIEVLPPGKTAIASGTPDITIVDETGNIDILNSILSDNLPTQYGFNPETGRLELMRQIILLGTGGYMEKAGIVLKSVFMAHWEAWEKRRFSSGIIPLYFNVWWRPGMTRALYEELKAIEYAKEGPQAAEDRIRFHQGHPITLEDVFLQGGKTLIGMAEIQKNIDRIADTNLVPDYGFFEPIYDTNSPAHEGSDVPYKIIGANFIPCGIGDDRNTTIIFQHPKRWGDRYYKGTDPIASDSGHSKMSSTIWDCHYNTPCAVVNYRSDDYNECFLQSLLLGIYYHPEPSKAVPEVLEANIGLAYRIYVINKGYEHSLVYSTELPDMYQTKGSTVLIGLDKKGYRSNMFVDDMRQIFETFSDRIMIPLYFIQLKTFICKSKASGGQKWEPMDKRYNWDDALDGLTYSYICAQCYAHKKPVNLDGQDSPERNQRTEYKFVHMDGQLRKVTKREYDRMKGKSGSIQLR